MLNILTAWPYMTDATVRRMQAIPNIRVMLDSGAFTAYKTGEVLNVDAYCDFIEKMPFAPWRYFNLDVIGDEAGSERNYRRMLDRGLKPMPIFTRGAPLSAIDEMYQTAEVVGIGGLVIAKNRPYRYVKAVMQHTAGRPVHLLGFVDPAWLPILKPYSCDSSSFTRGTRFGLIDVYLGDCQFARLYRNRAAREQPADVVMQAIRKTGLDPYALLKFENWAKDHGVGSWLAAWSWVAYSLDLEPRFGTKLFLASSGNALIRLEAAYRAITEGADYEAARQATIRKDTAA